jgi:hypothetical protein
VVSRVAGELHAGWVYRAEYLRVPHHNTLVYARCPARHLILFDIEMPGQHYLPYPEVVAEARRLSMDVVPLLYEGRIADMEQLRALLETESVLGGTTVEGVVIKNYGRFTRDKKAMMGKFVSERFKEKHDKSWKERNPSGRSVLGELAQSYRTEARWEKAVQHMREVGMLEGEPRDIGALIKLVQQDLLDEEQENIKAALFKWAWPDIKRCSTAGLPEWYKERLARRAFQAEEST